MKVTLSIGFAIAALIFLAGNTFAAYEHHKAMAELCHSPGWSCK